MKEKDLTYWRKRQQEAWTSLRQSQSPRQGIYYWLPRRRGGWRLLVWLAASNDPDALTHLSHLGVWSEVIEHLCHEWRLDVEDVRGVLVGQFAALPRGRVGFTHQQYWVIGRGTEVKVPNEIERVRRVFRLQGSQVRILEHDHWDPLRSEEATIKTFLGGTWKPRCTNASS